MRLNAIGLAICISAPLIFAQSSTRTILQPRESTVGVYTNQIRQVHEEALFKVTPEDRLLVIDEKGDFYKVRSADGLIGWVEKSLCINLQKSKTIKFDNQVVTGYLDNPTLTSIFGGDIPGEEPIYLDRSFKESIRDNIDQENVKRQMRN